mgnify:CR=1 FL=1
MARKAGMVHVVPDNIRLFGRLASELMPDIEKLVASVQIADADIEAISLKLTVSGRPGGPLRARAESADGRVAEARTEENLESARSRSLTVEIRQEHLGRLGGTSFRLGSLDASALEAGAFLGFPSLHALRRDFVKSLDSIAQYPVTGYRQLSKRALGSVSRTYFDPKSREIYSAVLYPGAMAQIAALESSPPLRAVPIGTSERIRSLQASRKSSRRASACS